MEKGSKNNTITTIVFSILVIVIACLIGYICYDKTKEEPKENNSGTQKTEEPKKENVVLNVEVKDNLLYVNNNKVDFYSVSAIKGNYANENEFYCSNGVEQSIETKYDLYKMNDVILVKLTPCNYDYQYVENYFVDANGKVLKKINGANADIELSINDTLFDVEKVEENTIYLSTTVDRAKYYGGVVCNKIKAGNGDEIVEYVDKITYANGEFKLEKAVSKTTYNEYNASGKNNQKCVID